jgi:hypothetical protein
MQGTFSASPTPRGYHLFRAGVATRLGSAGIVHVNAGGSVNFSQFERITHQQWAESGERIFWKG